MRFLVLLGTTLLLATFIGRDARAQDTAEAGQATVGGLLASPPPPAPASLDAELDAIATELGKLAASDAYKDEVVKRAVDRGRHAVLQTSRALTAQDGATAARKKQIAQAALALAQRAAARIEETRAEAAAAQGVKHAQEAHAQAAVVLEQAKQRLAALNAGQP
jgi:hypothetical protein